MLVQIFPYWAEAWHVVKTSDLCVELDIPMAISQLTLTLSSMLYVVPEALIGSASSEVSSDRLDL